MALSSCWGMALGAARGQDAEGWPALAAAVSGTRLTRARPQLIEDLRKQLEHLQLFKLEAEQRRGRGSSVGLQEYNSRTRESELEQEVRRLKQVRQTRPWSAAETSRAQRGAGGTRGAGALSQKPLWPVPVPVQPPVGSRPQE